ncbi:MAG TPA: hypothetical protein VKA41_04640 [Solirubrobacterales bacterium]|nr:hypothetical protein [Solirubrobacterales bacterium]
MREALNSNPVVQLTVIGVLVVVAGLFFMMNMKKEDSGSPAASSAASATSGSVAPGTTSPTTASPDGTVPGGAAGSASYAPLPSTGTVTPDALIPGPGLPAPVVKAWKGGDAIVLLVIRGGGIDDRLVRGSVQSLSGQGGVSVFVTRAKEVARYSRITQGVGVSQAPALVVIRPSRESGSVPEAQVSYGFRNSQSVVQAVDDALYNGRDNLPYSPR